MILPLALVLMLATGQPADAPAVSGRVVDASGAAVAGAEVSVGDVVVITGPQGRFSVSSQPGRVVVRVRAPGFAEHAMQADTGRPVRITLHPAGVSEALTVTALRSAERLADTATATTVIASAGLLTTAALTADDALRTTPGFSLFRRSSSRVANPTTQGASLRGLSASGASRGLVLADGVPLNDAFGGWVYWNRVPHAAIDRIEVVRGGSSAELYGNQAVAGTIQIFTHDPNGGLARLALEGGDRGAARASAFAGGRVSGWGGFAAAERFVYDGFPIVAEDERGPIDTDAGVKSWSGITDLGRRTGRWSAAMRASVLDEDRRNGTPLQVNDTNLATLSARSTHHSARGAWGLAAFAGTGDYDQSFSAVAAGRASETLTSKQRVRSEHQGVSAQWAGAWLGAAWLAGGEFRRVTGHSTPTPVIRGVPVEQPPAGGAQRDYAGFVQVTAQPRARVTLAAGARAGWWETGPAGGNAGSDQRWVFVLPRVSASWAPGDRVSFSASWTGAGRTPTLNELYRDFRVGNTVTAANPLLQPEDASTFDAGVFWRTRGASIRLAGFWTGLADAITNVTQSIDPALILRQRQNAGRIRARGLELEGEWRPAAWVSMTGSLSLFDSTFTRSAEPLLIGNRVPQVPRWQSAVTARMTPGRVVATIDWRGIGAQYDDDLNRFALRRAHLFDAYVGASFARLQPFVALENLFDVEVEVGRTPVTTVGTPRSLRAGVRVAFP